MSRLEEKHALMSRQIQRPGAQLPHCYKTGGEITLPRTDGDGPNCPWHGKRFLLVGKVNTSSSQCFSDNDEKFLPRVLPPD